MSDLSGNSVDNFVDKYGHALKPKAERVKEAVTILGKLREIGVPSNEVGYIVTKQKIDEWIQGGPAFNDIIEFPRLQRRAELKLPVKMGRVASLMLFAPSSKV